MKKFITVTSIIVLAVVLATMLMACTPSEDSLKKKYENAEYTVGSINFDEILELIGVEVEENTIKYAMKATKGLVSVNIVCFGDSDTAKEVYESVEKIFGDKCKKKGNAIAFGLTANEDALGLF